MANIFFLGCIGMSCRQRNESHAIKETPSLLSKNTMLVFVGSGNIRSFVAATSDGLPEHFVGLTAIEIQFYVEILPRRYFGRFRREGCGLLCLSVPRMRRVGFVLKPGLPGCFLYSNSVFHFLAGADTWNPKKVTLFTMILYNLENSTRDLRPFCRLLFCHRTVVKYASSLLE